MWAWAALCWSLRMLWGWTQERWLGVSITCCKSDACGHGADAHRSPQGEVSSIKIWFSLIFWTFWSLFSYLWLRALAQGCAACVISVPAVPLGWWASSRAMAGILLALLLAAPISGCFQQLCSSHPHSPNDTYTQLS